MRWGTVIPVTAALKTNGWSEVPGTTSLQPEESPPPGDCKLCGCEPLPECQDAVVPVGMNGFRQCPRRAHHEATHKVEMARDGTHLCYTPGYKPLPGRE